MSSLIQASVNDKTPGNAWTQRWVMYHEKVRSPGGIFMYDSSPISPLPVVLFGESQVQQAAGEGGGLAYFSQDAMEADVVSAMSSDQQEARRIISDVLKASGGCYKLTGANGLSKLLKSARPDLRDAIGKVRLFLTAQGFKVEKQGGGRGGGWFVYDKADREERYLGVQDWVYFGCSDDRVAQLVSDCRDGIDLLLKKRMEGASYCDKQDHFVTTLVDAIEHNDSRNFWDEPDGVRATDRQPSGPAFYNSKRDGNVQKRDYSGHASAQYDRRPAPHGPPRSMENDTTAYSRPRPKADGNRKTGWDD